MNTPKGAVYLEHYPIKLANDIPKLVINTSDGFWYQFFEEQAVTLWEIGMPWECS
jgi:hypothetical protein